MFVPLTLNPAIDRILRLDQPLQPGELHRVTERREQAGGKGVNVARALRTLGAEVTAAGVLAGFNGQKFAALLAAEGLAGQHVFLDRGETRECQIVLREGHPTEINEAGVPHDASALERLLTACAGHTLVLCGSLPPGMPLEAFGALIHQQAPAAADTSGPALRTALEAGAALVKPNEAELRQIAGSAELEAARRLRERFGSRLLVTRGAQGAWLVGQETWEARVPRVDVANPVGAGDCTLAGFLWAEAQGLPEQEALAWAVACGSASALQGGPTALTRQAAEELRQAVEVSRAR
ncbi:hypothetical protein E5F05_01160 (plasmid) [Deinococcus metallilatus]|uniref:1-phosphofructokinase/tagatose 6-phosphate kinase n=1 Tax=Deinococcus metallilatus TaxID=1211322 RepID=A0AAJ5JZV8_9DEIO|nr:hexose kinase [Deinococcus metallilatus]MBB5293518.1 1-phosphofructokinase/tagatose 6-phosphate kinase [Deinococcus metallilatus]QBY06595.1 hypothetical protein E5F05_01160 [Deinococcus metallilatus]RXJ17938.1 hypothetical protein ERJ73_00770 [Deinococcus metallilatus]TLK32209.1 hypothetical protein FCS05_01790 [Deinococcus metallilatus]GMA15262.1 sugar kinase [Deinococcus metallilatus]